MFKKEYTSEEADKIVKNGSAVLTAVVLFSVNVCLPVCVIGGILYFIFGGK